VTQSIRFRLAGVSALAVGVVGAVIGVAAYLRVSADLAIADAEFARHEALEVAQVIASLSSPEEVRRKLLDSEPKIFPEEGVERLQVFSLDGVLVASLPHDAPPEPWDEGLTRARRGEFPTEAARTGSHWSLRSALLVTYTREPRWLAVARVDCARSERSLKQLRRYVAGGVPLTALAVFVGTYGLLVLALAPLRVLVNDARALAAEGLGRRLAQPSPGSELAELVRLLNVMLARAEETVGGLRRFAADASHELRTPLARMRGEAEVALRGGDPEEARGALVSILDELDKLRRLIDGLLELARGDAADLQAGPPFDLGALAGDLAEEARVLGEARGLDVHVERDGATLLVRGRRDLIGRALWNLLGNALKYVPPGRRIDVTITRQDEAAQVVVADTGPGLTDELRGRLFQPFVRGDPARSADGAEGHGLGLALARTIARRSGGDLVCERGADAGARFVLTLPVVDPPGAA
jgi:signal transduction histidine kinase